MRGHSHFNILKIIFGPLPTPPETISTFLGMMELPFKNAYAYKHGFWHWSANIWKDNIYLIMEVNESGGQGRLNVKKLSKWKYAWVSKKLAST